ncbi:MAG: molybdopterin molybdotransferase MoeA [Proteobacteria bacterium]|nr:molybdopterin molybdotransferase MoeA [Pseudomonadota bacterium]
MISVAEALAKVLAGIKEVSAEQVALSDALGRVLSEDIAARLTHPPADVSAMDGYAVRAEDVAKVPVTLKQIGESQAGSGFDGSVGSGETARIFTGAPLPDGADAIVIQEDTETDGDAITMKEAVAPGKFVRPAGMDFNEGDVLLKAGQVLSARAVGLAGAMNVPHLNVRRRPRIAFLSTGDELVMPGDPVGPDQIINSNAIAMGAYVQALGGEPHNLGIARDTEESLRHALEGAAGADLLVTMGGASVGDYDLVQKVLGEQGMDLGFYKVAMRPGKPLIFGTLRGGALAGIPVLGLPGNPVSAGVTAAIFLKAAMEKMLGIPDNTGPAATAVLSSDLGKNGWRQDYMRARLSHDKDGNLVATPFEAQDSSMQARLAEAGCLIVRAPDAPPAKKGERVEIIPLAVGTVLF